ncbi:Protein-tyrosine phosphatase, receptor/non-receptor type domain and Protein-tyrosine/Dual specificity phosphatase domain and Protein-tyrosine phosphatase, catalytic domain-containing protein [Strongyloides ratti]|uniref:Protein-tyrosine phosphatase, receptor/non-receptor type domain and Protein-tyrosine/Dual specificity phosphatase domain and Protein-tyrosine phosphatase, catalytic domain-containing protein n=1 Tax=Strongyloides ratti TaxID=34506 RepID=A0A090L609_STRRB|nr:Protein-tyrosine phosphatase, receptor/non-receptor type domain and Protein-tyrosine/Dual specificity phosphatase domain and Protein-tyrosine phosphatase, catalytic domain-containing protein [Strongyloides ratti]CEF65191.1 Protein-tyrosine phosphatase, receptor/non-receptor type domain and Protein-tyrosine/Dual specificity phosphatase domain and Protein-tyrosine phosphatase, catalytic domain-containing protein [Strongyloides ratti]
MSGNEKRFIKKEKSNIYFNKINSKKLKIHYHVIKLTTHHHAIPYARNFDGSTPFKGKRYFDDEVSRVTDLQQPSVFKFDANYVRTILTNAAGSQDDDIAKFAITDPRFDEEWKKFDEMKDAMNNSSGGIDWRTKYSNKNKSWIVPLKRVAQKFFTVAGKPMDDDNIFFTENMKLNDCRCKLIRQLMIEQSKPSLWLLGTLSDCERNVFDNPKLRSYLSLECNRTQILRRAGLFKQSIEKDRVYVRLRGKYYNNINLGKHIFNAPKRPMYAESIVGGMERRFEIMDSEVNHVVYQPAKSSNLSSKIRNSRIQCNVGTMFKINESLFNNNSKNDRFGLGCNLPFIHANVVDDPILFNTFIITQAPMKSTAADFWKMTYQSGAKYIFMLVGKNDPSKCYDYYPKSAFEIRTYDCLTVECIEIDGFTDPFFTVSRIRVTHREKGPLYLEHWQCDMNNSSNLELPLRLLRLARNCNTPTIVHDHYGVSRAACLIAIELGICRMMRGPTIRFPIQHAVQTLRKYRSFSIETPMQYIYINRCVIHFLKPLIGSILDFDSDYKSWLESRQKRLFIDKLNSAIPEYLQLSPTFDPDLLPKVNHDSRRNIKIFPNSTIGYMPKVMERKHFVRFDV